MEDEIDVAAVFDGVVASIIPCEELDNGDRNELRKGIELNGGAFRPLNLTDKSIVDIDSLTHIVSSHIDFPEYSAALEHGIHVVKPFWIIHSIQKQKQASARQYSPDPSQIFQDVVLTCADLPAGDARAITAGVIVLGGQYSGPLTKLVTHIVTTSMDHERCQIADAKGLKCKIVLPHWIDACLKLGKRISEGPYLFPNPEILREGHSGSIRPHPTPQLEGADTATPKSLPLPTSPSKSRKSLDALMGRKVYLAMDLELSDHLLKTIRDLIELGGGVLTNDVSNTDIFIGQFRDGEAYVDASRSGKTVANLSWLYHVINRNRYTNPLSKLLHYPVPRNGIPGFENMKISISNYSGDARPYVENLVRYCGAEFTKTMKQDNTHLITAHMQSEKCEAAQEWNINIINHLWLEESFAKCAVQTLSNPRYSTFPARTNLGEVAGQTALDMKSVERVFFPKPRSSPQKPKSPAKPSRKTEPASSAVQNPVSANNDSLDVPRTIEEADETANAPEPSTAKRSRGRPRKSVATPRPGGDDKENESPMVTSVGRASKAKALSNLQNQADDIALFQKEMKRKGGVTHGGRRQSRDDGLSSPIPPARNSKKRSSDEYDAPASEGDLSDGETQPPASKANKRTKSSPVDLPPVHTRMMVTGYDRWKDDKHTESTDRDQLRLLGVLVTVNPKDVDMLVAPRLSRTQKFVSALASAPMVVDTKYLDVAITKHKLMKDPPLLEDRDGEDRMGFKLADALQRAEINQRNLFRGWSIFVTKDVNGGFGTYQEIIRLNGGAPHLYAGRTGVVLPKRRLRDDPASGSESQNQGGEEEFDFIYLVSGSSDAEKRLWKTFKDMARKQELKVRIVTTDWLLNAAMSQQITFNDKWLL